MREIAAQIYHHHGLQVRFLFVGGINTLVGILFFPVLYVLLPLMHAHYLFLMIFCQIFCITFSYMTNKYFVFRSKAKSFLEYLRFTFFYNIVFVINLIILPWLVLHAALNPARIQLMINMVIAVGSYFWHRSISFPKNDAK